MCSPRPSRHGQRGLRCQVPRGHHEQHADTTVPACPGDAVPYEPGHGVHLVGEEPGRSGRPGRGTAALPLARHQHAEST